MALKSRPLSLTDVVYDRLAKGDQDPDYIKFPILGWHEVHNNQDRFLTVKVLSHKIIVS